MIVVVGAGPAGMAAALRAHECGAEVLVIDDNVAPGGQIWRADEGNGWVRRFRAAGLPLLSESRVVTGDAKAKTLVLETPAGRIEVGYSSLILATGSREMFLPFRGWTLPGVFGAGGLQALAKSGLAVKGKRIVVGGTGPLLLAVAAYLRTRGAEVRLIAEQAPRSSLARFGAQVLRSGSKLWQGAGLGWALAGIPYLPGCWIEAAHGEGRVRSVTVRRGREAWVEECDYAGIGYGLVANRELEEFLGEDPSIYVAGTGEAELSLVEGEIAGYAAAGRVDRAEKLYPKRARARRFAAAIDRAFALREELKQLAAPECVLCRCEDVQVGQLWGFGDSRNAKLHTRFGMGPCQGRVCGPAAQFLFGWDAGRLRPPLFPAKISTLLATACVPATTE